MISPPDRRARIGAVHLSAESSKAVYIIVVVPFVVGLLGYPTWSRAELVWRLETVVKIPISRAF